MTGWAPHRFAAAAKEAGIDEDLVASMIHRGDAITQKNGVVVFTLRHLAAICEVSYKFLRLVVERKIDPYRSFDISKRSGGKREICVPDPHLMGVQRWINEMILQKQKPGRVSKAFSEGDSPRGNAEIHCGAKWLIKVDVKDFFGSISERDAYFVFRELEYPALLSFELARICTRIGSRPVDLSMVRRGKTYQISDYDAGSMGTLPQGAPTSPMLANLTCRTLDNRLQELGKRFGGVVTRYADDVVFSALELDRERAVQVLHELRKLLSQSGFSGNSRKEAIVPPGARRIVTGLLVDSDQPRLSKAFRGKLRMHLYHARTKGIVSHCKLRKFRSLVGFRAHLEGLISYARSIDPTFGEKCEEQFLRIDWGMIGDV